MAALELRTYEIFKAHMGEEDAGTIMGYIDDKMHHEFDGHKSELMTKDDKRDLEKQIEGVKVDMHKLHNTTLKWMVTLFVSLFLSLFLSIGSVILFKH